MLAYNLNCWLQLFNREEGGEVGSMRHTTLATARLRFLFLAAKIWRHAGRVGISYSDHYEDQGQRAAQASCAVQMPGLPHRSAWRCNRPSPLRGNEPDPPGTQRRSWR